MSNNGTRKVTSCGYTWGLTLQRTHPEEFIRKLLCLKPGISQQHCWDIFLLIPLLITVQLLEHLLGHLSRPKPFLSLWCGTRVLGSPPQSWSMSGTWEALLDWPLGIAGPWKGTVSTEGVTEELSTGVGQGQFPRTKGEKWERLLQPWACRGFGRGCCLNLTGALGSWVSWKQL